MGQSLKAVLNLLKFIELSSDILPILHLAVFKIEMYQTTNLIYNYKSLLSHYKSNKDSWL